MRYNYVPPSSRLNSTKSTLQTWLSTSGNDHNTLQADGPVCPTARWLKDPCGSQPSQLFPNIGSLFLLPNDPRASVLGRLRPRQCTVTHLAQMPFGTRDALPASASLQQYNSFHEHANPCITFGPSSCLPYMSTRHRPTSSRLAPSPGNRICRQPWPATPPVWLSIADSVLCAGIARQAPDLKGKIPLQMRWFRPDIPPLAPSCVATINCQHICAQDGPNTSLACIHLHSTETSSSCSLGSDHQSPKSSAQ